MGRTLQPPAELDVDYFVVIYERDSEVYTVALPDGSSYMLGGVPETKLYLTRIMHGNTDLAERAIDFAYNFGVSQVIPKSDRSFPIDDVKQVEDVENNLKIPDNFEESNWEALMPL